MAGGRQRGGRLDLLQMIARLKMYNPTERWTRVAIDLGAGVKDIDPTFPLFARGWEGLIVDADEKLQAPMAKRFPAEGIL